MSLTSCLEEIKKVKPAAEEELEAGNPATLNARRGRQRAAKERILQLRDEYGKELRNSSMYVIAVGTLAKEFAEASEAFSGFVHDPEHFYKDLASRIPTTLYQGKATVSNIFDVMGRHLEDKMREIGIVSYPQMIMKAAYARTINSVEDFTELLKQAVNEQVGAEIIGHQATASTIDRAIEREHAGSTTMMLLPTQDENLAKAMAKDLKRLTPNVFVVAAGKAPKAIKDLAGPLAVKNISEESLENVVKAIKNLKQ